jgi:hypothetical protein
MFAVRMQQVKEGSLVAQANAILARAGYAEDGRPKSDKRVSVRAISTPCGGKPTDRKR